MLENTLKNIKSLAATSKRLEKEAIIANAWKQGDSLLFLFAKYCYDPFLTFGVAEKMVPVKTLETREAGNLSKDTLNTTPDEFSDLIEKLAFRKLTGHDARDAIHSFMMRTSIDIWNTIYRPVLLKDLRTGCTENTFNKVIEQLIKQNDPFSGALKGLLIPTFEVQLAKDSADETLEGEVILQDKLDGVRLITICDKDNNKITHYTRNGKENANFPHITEIFQNILSSLPESMVFDGEVVGTNFQSLMTQVNRKDNVSSKNTSLALFDCLTLSEFKNGISETSQSQRIEKLNTFSQFHANSTVYTLSSVKIDMSLPEGQKLFIEFNKKALSEGKEGIMIKDPKAPYECKRSKSWLKMKPFISVSLPIISVEEGTGKYSAHLGNVICRGVDSSFPNQEIEVSVGSGFSDEQRKEYWIRRDKLIGMIAEIKADVISKDRTDDSLYSLRFPRFLGFRGAKPGEKI